MPAALWESLDVSQQLQPKKGLETACSFCQGLCICAISCFIGIEYEILASSRFGKRWAFARRVVPDPFVFVVIFLKEKSAVIRKRHDGMLVGVDC